MMAVQSSIVALLVLGCTLYAAWKLMPSAARRALADALLRVPHLPRRFEALMRGAAKAATGCGCDGCDRSELRTPATSATTQPITFHPRPPPR